MDLKQLMEENLQFRKHDGKITATLNRNALQEWAAPLSVSERAIVDAEIDNGELFREIISRKLKAVWYE